MSTVTIKILTPIHIGSGKTLTKDIDFVFFANLHNKPLAIIDEQKIFNVVTEKHFDKWIANIENPQKGGLLSFLQGIDNHIKPEDISKRITTVQGNIGNKTQVHEQIHNGQLQPYLPGSSLKGAIRTAILSCLFTSKKEFLQKEDNLKDKGGRFNDSGIVGHYVADDTPKNQQNKDFFRFLQVGDAVFQKTQVIEILTYNQKGDEWEKRNDLSQWTEVIPQGLSATVRIQTLEEKIHNHKNITIEQKFKDYISKNADNVGKEKLIQNINQHTQRLLEKEYHFIREQDDDYLYDYKEQIRELLTDIKQCKNNECILRVGKHIGFNFMTGGWQESTLPKNVFEFLKGKVRGEKYMRFALPKTRRFLSDGTPIGFVKLIFNN